MNRKTKRQIILETAAYYGSDPTRRSVLNSGKCVYVNSTGAMCAIGRLMTDAGLKVHYLDYIAPPAEIEPEYIQPEYRDAIADPEFAEDLQNLHDVDAYWDDEGLTETGKQVVLDMLDLWSN